VGDEVLSENECNREVEYIGDYEWKKELEDRYVKKMKEQQNNPDIEEAHGIADDLLCQLLKELGFKKLVEEYEKVPKYYA